MKQILSEIQSGKFAKEWIAENEAGRPKFKVMREQDKNHPIEVVGATLRAMMPFLKKTRKAPTAAAAPEAPASPAAMTSQETR
jgi:ketol-acid reductoisomerase